MYDWDKRPDPPDGAVETVGWPFTEVSFLETCEAHAGWKQTWPGRDPGFLVQTFMADACFRPKKLSQTSKFSRTPTKCLRLTKESLLWFLCQRGHFLSIFYLFSTYFLLLTWDFSYIFSQRRCCAVAHFKGRPPGQLACVQRPWCDLNGYEWWWMVLNG